MDENPSNILQRLAQALGLPESALFEEPAQFQQKRPRTLLEDAKELLGVFSEIEDPEIRRMAIAHVKSLVVIESLDEQVPKLALAGG